MFSADLRDEMSHLAKVIWRRSLARLIAKTRTASLYRYPLQNGSKTGRKFLLYWRIFSKFFSRSPEWLVNMAEDGSLGDSGWLPVAAIDRNGLIVAEEGVFVGF